MKKNTLKVILAVVLALCLIVGVSACSSKKGDNEGDNEYIEVTDINGEVVTDANGNPVTERVDLENANGEKVTAGRQSSGSNSGSTGNDGSENTAGNNGSGGGNSDSGDSQENTTVTETTTEKPKKRDFSVTVKMPYKNDEDSTLIIAYRVAGETEYTKLDPVEVKLDGEEYTFDLDSAKGAVSVIIGLSGVDIAPDTDRGIIEASQDNVIISPKIGIEIADGGWD